MIWGFDGVQLRTLPLEEEYHQTLKDYLRTSPPTNSQPIESEVVQLIALLKSDNQTDDFMEAFGPDTFLLSSRIFFDWIIGGPRLGKFESIRIPEWVIIDAK